MQYFKTNAVKSAIIGIHTLLFIGFMIAALSLGRVILIPLALAILLAFLLSPLVSKLEHWIGRSLAVIFVVATVTVATGFIGYVLSKEFVRFATDLPVYKTNIDAKISSLRAFKENVFDTSAIVVSDLKNKLSGTPTTANVNQSEIINSNQLIISTFEFIFGSFINIVGTIFLVILLVGFILFDREDLRGRIIRLLGQRQIGATTLAMDDASKRVSRYLRMQLFVNILYGAAVTIGLFVLNIPNPFLWGALSTILRFIPYVGAWIAAAVPIALSFAISNTWLVPFLTVSWFVLLELLISNILEPWLYGVSTGVSSTALIIAALFWTWLWGPIGLLLSTPLTVCLVVIGRHVPRFEFFSILLSDEEALALYEEYYHRLLASNINEVMNLTDIYLKDKTLISLYDSVIIPVITNVEKDTLKETLDVEQAHMVQQNLADIVEDLSTRPPVIAKETPKKDQLEAAKQKTIESEASRTNEVIVTLPAKALRDEMVGEMITQLLKQYSYNAFNVPSQFKVDDMLEFVKNNKASTIIISVISPSTIIQARYLSRKMRSHFPSIKIIVGLWGSIENLADATEGLRASGADEVVTSLADAISHIDQNFTP